ncbi:ACP phosphodiesterase [Massilia sp. PAMC28688]|uniref:acyl carrier protein phosphodiesterase n=1 Tax=Massilia sp. PAMC28688 TaxID=2861283 RepID=UPI001C62504D|nr:ACP phosphodiesterase [Massilia sp. PAMC28688]QYF93672.1 ACP phosphodiesterase [Massilia sp. PAMC28688]
MNFLAHAFLARHTDAAMVGALLGDFAKADAWTAYPPPVALEIIVHRQVDSFTDSHPATLEALALFAPARRRFAGIALDVFYDHLLSRHWAQYSDLPRRQFIAQFYAALLAHDAILPERLRAILPSLVGHDWLARYHHMDGVAWAVTRMSQRLSKNGQLLRDCLPDLHAHYGALEALFDAFFPELVAFVPAARARVLAGRALPRPG